VGQTLPYTISYGPGRTACTGRASTTPVGPWGSWAGQAVGGRGGAGHDRGPGPPVAGPPPRGPGRPRRRT